MDGVAEPDGSDEDEEYDRLQAAMPKIHKFTNSLTDHMAGRPVHVAKALFSITVSHAPASSRVAAGRLPNLSYDTLGGHCAPESAPCPSTRLERGLVSDSCGRERALWEPLSSRKSWR